MTRPYTKRKKEYIRTPEIRERIRQSLLGNIPWNKGKKRPPFSREWKEKMRIAHLGNKSHTGEVHDEEYKKKMSESCKGIKKHDGFGIKVSKALKGKRKTPEHCKNLSIAHKGKQVGEKNPNWRGGLSSENEKIRSSVEYKWWRKAVFERDGYRCVHCGIKGNGKNLNAHHIKSFAEYPELRLAIDNGITLCKSCHKKIHKIKKYATKTKRKPDKCNIRIKSQEESGASSSPSYYKKLHKERIDNGRLNIGKRKTGYIGFRIIKL